MPRTSDEWRADSDFLSDLAQLSERMAEARPTTPETEETRQRGARKFAAESIAAQKFTAQKHAAQKLDAQKPDAQRSDAKPHATSSSLGLSGNEAAPLKTPPKRAAAPAVNFDSVAECQPPTASGLFSLLDPASSGEYREQFLLLRTQLLLHRSRYPRETDFRVVSVMSTHKGEGKSFTATNLAAVLASAAGKKVLLIDSDPVSRPLPLGIPPAEPAGLSRALATPADWIRTIHRVKNTPLHVMPRGSQNTAATLNLEPFPRLLVALREHFDWIILDGAAFASCPDAPWLASVADGNLLVVRESAASFGAVHDSIACIPPDRFIGVVFNQRKCLPKARLRIRVTAGRKTSDAAPAA